MLPSDLLPPLLHRLLTMSLEASVLTLLIAAVLLIFRHRIPPRWRYILWSLVLVKLILPTSLPTSLSLYNLLPARPSTPAPTLTLPTPLTPPTPPLSPRRGGYLPSPIFPPPLPEPLTPPTTSLSAPVPYLTVLYLTGALTLTLLVVTQSLRLSLAIRAQRPLTDQTTLDLLEDAKQQMRVRTHLPLIETDRVAPPSLFGFIRPKLLLPARSYERLLRDQLRHVLLHELAHLKRLDVPINCLATLLLILHWFNPLIWIVLARMRAERELACDAMVLDLLHREPDAPHAYGQTLLELLAEPARTRPLANLACVLENPHQLKHRIAMIASFRPTPWLTTLTAASLLLLLTAVGLTQAKPHQDHPPKSKPAATESPTTPPPSPGMAMPGSPDSSISPATQPTTRAIGNAYLMGAISRPGTYGLPPDADLTLRNLLAAAGGLDTDQKSDPWIYLYRNQGQNTFKQILAAPYTQAIAAPNNPTVIPGDLILVTKTPLTPFTPFTPSTSQPRVYLEGPVPRPGTYSLTKDGPLTLIQLLAAAGLDLAAHGNDTIVLLRRTTDKTEQRIDVHPVDILSGATPDISLQPNDMVSVVPHAPGVASLVTPIPPATQPSSTTDPRASKPGPSGPDAPSPDPQQRRQPFLDRINLDRQRYSPQQMGEIESLYLYANKNWGAPQAIENLQTLISRYPGANHTGCAMLYLGQLSQGPIKERYLQHAIGDYFDCLYDDGVQVGPYAMFHLARHYADNSRPADAQSLLDRLRRDYPTAIDHQGRLLIDQLPSIPPATQPAASPSPRPDPQQRRQPFLDRINLDRQRYSPDQRREIERLYQVANKNWRSPQAVQSLETLIARYPDANRTGCALLYLGQMSEGPTRERYLLRAMNDFPDCYYGDGVQVGPYAMLHLAHYYLNLNRPDDAQPLLDKIRHDHPTAIDHRGRLLIDHLPEMTPAQTPPSQNLLMNPGAELGSDAPAHWSQGAAVQGVQYLWDRHAGFSSNASLCLTKTANRYFPIAQWHQTVERTGAAPRLHVSAQVKAENVTKAILDVLFLDENDQWIRHQWVSYIGSQNDGDPPANHDWKPYAGQLDIPQNTKKIQIGLQIYGPGKVWFDDITATYVQ
ncbi:MAG: SLBB domain-containing protein [Phycisphaeraceae bacterium]|nr:SLBB domain-containing protein [Phycisphaeraceae bacterium]